MSDDLVKQLRSGLDNSDGGEMGGVVLTMNEAADRIEQLEAQVKAADALAEAHGKLWSALAEIIEIPGMSPNATAIRMAERAEKALVENTIADLKPVPRFYKEGGA